MPNRNSRGKTTEIMGLLNIYIYIYFIYKYKIYIYIYVCVCVCVCVSKVMNTKIFKF